MSIVSINVELKILAKINVRPKEGSDSKIGVLNKDSTVVADGKRGNWYRLAHGAGWIEGTNTKVNRNLDVNPYVATQQVTISDGYVKDELGITESRNLLNLSTVMSTNIIQNGLDYNIKTLRGIYAMPHQFLSTADPRPVSKGKSQKVSGLTEESYGRKYGDAIFTNAPIMMVTPGRADFLTKFSNSAKGDILKTLVNVDKGADSSVLESIIEGKNSQYYSFRDDYAGYIKYVNAMCMQTALFLGIGDRVLYKGAAPYKKFDWSEIPRQDIDRGLELGAILHGSFRHVSFFIDSASSFDEGGSSSTDRSMLDSSLNSASDVVKEAQFLIENLSATDIDALATDRYEEDIQKIAKSMTKNPMSLINRVMSSTTTIVKGGNLVFPEIWKDSSFGKSYSVNIKLVSPYGDAESIFLNILVPLYHILGFSLPRQVGQNGIFSPYLVQVFCKGWFNCTMGIVDSISITKSTSNNWSVLGLPTELDVRLNIKDMYSSLSMTSWEGSSKSMFFDNICLLDFLATMSGVNINKPDITRKLESMIAAQLYPITNAKGNITNAISQTIYNINRKLFGY